ncbi:MAG: diacylglycerol kinase [Nitrospirota bacterium]|jgi:diacylglycerol kinase (ATP)
MRPSTWFESANVAIEGILHTARTQRHMRWHFLAAIAVIMVSLFLRVPKLEFLALVFAILLVLIAEMINTAVEVAVDLVSPSFHPQAKLVKDVAAGAVLLAAIGAGIVGYLVLYPHVRGPVGAGIAAAQETAEHLTAIALILVIILVIVAKATVGAGRPLRGGMPSGHAAVAFSVWVSSWFLSGHPGVFFLTFVLAVMVARSRVSLGIHSVRQVILGALLGSLTTLAVFGLFG